jgi:hypothetical protein
MRWLMRGTAAALLRAGRSYRSTPNHAPSSGFGPLLRLVVFENGEWHSKENEVGSLLELARGRFVGE